MKVGILVFCLFMGMTAQAQNSDISSMSTEAQTQLFQTLIKMEPQAIHSLLSDEGFDWFMERLEESQEEDQLLLSLMSLHSRIKPDYNPYDDPNAPTF